MTYPPTATLLARISLVEYAWGLNKLGFKDPIAREAVAVQVPETEVR